MLVSLLASLTPDMEQRHAMGFEHPGIISALSRICQVSGNVTRGCGLLGRLCLAMNVVSPGITAAGMAEASIAAGKYDRFLDEGLIGRFGRAIDVARAVRFFLEPDNYVTGQVLCVDGGITL